LGNALRLSDGLPFPEAQYYLAVALTELDMDDRACDALRDYGQISDLDTPERIEEAARLAERLGCN
jgi:hypothetical protein